MLRCNDFRSRIFSWVGLMALAMQQVAETQQQQVEEQQGEYCKQLRYVSRQQWGAKEANIKSDSNSGSEEESQPTFSPQRVFVHQAWDGRTCYDIDSCSVRLQAMQAYHQHSKGWPDISYNFLISGDGSIYEGRGFQWPGYHTLNYNQDSLGVALIGTFHETRPPVRMFAALEALIGCALESGKLQPDYLLHGHRDARCTICPGDAAYARLAEIAHFRPGPLERYSCPNRPVQAKAEEVSALEAAIEQPELRVFGNNSYSVAAAEGRAAPSGIRGGGGGGDESGLAKLVQNGDQMKTINVNSHNRLVALALHTNAAPESGDSNHLSSSPASSGRTTAQPIDLVEEAFVGVLRRRLTGDAAQVGGSRQRKRQAHLSQVQQQPQSQSQPAESEHRQQVPEKRQLVEQPHLKEAINRNLPDNRVVVVSADGATVQPSFYVLTNGRTAPGAIIITGGGGGGGGATTARPAATTTTARPTTTTARPASTTTTTRPPTTTTRPPTTTTRPPTTTTRPPTTTTRSPAAAGQEGNQMSEPTQVGSLLSRLLSMSFFGDITLF